MHGSIEVASCCGLESAWETTLSLLGSPFVVVGVRNELRSGGGGRHLLSEVQKDERFPLRIATFSSAFTSPSLTACHITVFLVCNLRCF